MTLEELTDELLKLFYADDDENNRNYKDIGKWKVSFKRAENPVQKVALDYENKKVVLR